MELIHNIIPSLVDEEDNHFFCLFHLEEEIHSVVFDMDAASAPGPDVFKDCYISSVGR